MDNSCSLCPWGLFGLVPMSACSFNGEPKAQAKYGIVACGLPLND